MLTMAHSCNTSDRGSWKESYRSSDSVESAEDSVDSDHSSSSSGGGGGLNGLQKSNSHLPGPIGCITTNRVSAVIRPERKMPPIDPLQFVKVKKNDLCIKAVEQIKLAEEVKITKEKIKEEEEEWQNNLLNWKSKRKLTKNNSDDDSLLPRNPNRKTKTFSEILNEKAKSGGRIGYNLQQYVEPNGDIVEGNRNETNQDTNKGSTDGDEEYDDDNDDNVQYFPLKSNEDQCIDVNSYVNMIEQNSAAVDTNLNRLLNASNGGDNGEPKCLRNSDEEDICRDGLGDVVVYGTTLLEEFSVKVSDSNCDNANVAIEACGVESRVEQDCGDQLTAQTLSLKLSEDTSVAETKASSPPKVHVPINEWKSSHANKANQPKLIKQHSVLSEDDTIQHPIQHHNSSFEVEDEDEELDEESERIRLDQERSFKAKLHAFESLAKQEEEAAKRAAEANRRRQQNRAKLAAERSKSLCNILQSTSSAKTPLKGTHSVSSSMIQNNTKPNTSNSNKTHNENSTSKSLQNLTSKASPNSVVYNFKDKSPEVCKTNVKSPEPQKPLTPQPALEIVPENPAPQAQNIYENITQISMPPPPPPPPPATQPVIPKTANQPEEPVADSDALRNVSQKLLQQQQQIYQNQPMPGQYPNTNQSQYTNFTGFPYDIPSKHQASVAEHPKQPTDTILNDQVINPVPIRGAYLDDVGLPPIQITKTTQSVYNGVPTVPSVALNSPPTVQPEEHLYQNQLMIKTNAAAQNHTSKIPIYDYSNLPNYDSYHDSEPNYENKAVFHQHKDDVGIGGNGVVYSTEHYQPALNTYANSQYLYYPKPYSANNSAIKSMPKQQQQQTVHQNGRYGLPNGRVAYNQNHWLIQEAEFRRQHDSLEPNGQRMKPPSTGIPHMQHQSKGNGYLSVSGKKKCSSCGDELGKGCAAMVVESLSLYYHINCFRCSVCNIQLGNGTVGTDVRVRNNKLHCQNCYSNDEAGLKFSRV